MCNEDRNDNVIGMYGFVGDGNGYNRNIYEGGNDNILGISIRIEMMV